MGYLKLELPVFEKKKKEERAEDTVSCTDVSMTSDVGDRPDRFDKLQQTSTWCC